MLDYADKNYGFDTLMVHAGTQPDPETHSVALPIYQTTAYTFDSTEHAARLFELKEPGNIYTRLSNPTVDALERRVAALDGGIGALAFASGHAAMVHTFLNLAGAGDEIVSSICIYGGAINMMGVTLGRIGVKVKFVDPGDLGRLGGGRHRPHQGVFRRGDRQPQRERGGHRGDRGDRPPARRPDDRRLDLHHPLPAAPH